MFKWFWIIFSLGAPDYLIYGLINKKVTPYKQKTILCKNLKTIDLELLTYDLSNALWHVGELRN